MTGVRFPVGAGIISLRHRVQTGSEAHPASYPVGIGVFSPGIKRSGREADQSLPPSSKVKNAWTYTSTPPTSSRSGV
jgi:hypothetical protein